MPILKNARHELFAQELAKGKTQDEAYIAVGFSPRGARANAARLIANDSVRARVIELQSLAAVSAAITAESLMLEGMELLKAAKDAKDFKAASQTLERVAKIAGVWVDRSESKDSGLSEFLAGLK